MNMFIGVMFSCFQSAYTKEKISTESSQLWWDLMQQLSNVMPEKKRAIEPGSDSKDKEVVDKNSCKFMIRKFCWKIVNDPKFEVFIFVIILLNLITMTMNYENAVFIYNQVIENFSVAFTFVFVAECILKLTAYGSQDYFYEPWNRFDFFVVVSGLTDIMFSLTENKDNFQFSGLFKTFQVMRIFRIIRVIRIFKLGKSMTHITRLFQSFMWSYYGLLNVLLLYLLSVFIFSLLGCFIYKDLQYSKNQSKFVNVTPFFNFDDFFRSVILLLHSNCESYEYFMFEYMQANPTRGNVSTTITYFFVFNFFCFIIMLNLFLLIIIMQYDEFYNKKVNPIDKFEAISKEFKKIWYESVVGGTTDDLMRIHQCKLKSLFEEFEKSHVKEILTEDELKVKSDNLFISNLRLFVDGNNYIYFRDVFYKLMKNHYGQMRHKTMIIKEKEQMLMKQIIKEIKDLNLRMVGKENDIFSETLVEIKRYNYLQPFLIFKVSYRLFRMFTRKLQQTMKIEKINSSKKLIDT